jgi:hypothetical protein
MERLARLVYSRNQQDAHGKIKRTGLVPTVMGGDYLPFPELAPLGYRDRLGCLLATAVRL